jgi:hypothetical protein
MEAALKKLLAIALLAAFAGTSGTALAAKKARQATPPADSEMYGSAPTYGPAPTYGGYGYGPGYGPLIDAPVALPYGGYYFGAGCTTDEGYGRRGSCDAPGGN